MALMEWLSLLGFTVPSAPYRRAEETEVNVVFSLDPRPLVTVIMATAIPAAMRPYSIAVAPVSSLKKAVNFFPMPGSLFGRRSLAYRPPAPEALVWPAKPMAQTQALRCIGCYFNLKMYFLELGLLSEISEIEFPHLSIRA